MNISPNQTYYATVHTLLDRLDKVRQTGDSKWMARCPAHDDKGPSLSVRDTGERTLIHCFAGCAAEDVLSAVGLSWPDIVRDKWQAAEHAATHQKVRLKPVDPLALEWRIIRLAQADLAAGREVSFEDRARVAIAYERIQEADHGR